jgi:protein-L-isoaspartate O-methyltransferase
MYFTVWENIASNATMMANNGPQNLSLWRGESIQTGHDDIKSYPKKSLKVDTTIWKVGCSKENAPLFYQLIEGGICIAPFGEYSTLSLYKLPEGMTLCDLKEEESIDLQEYFNQEVWPSYASYTG